MAYPIISRITRSSFKTLLNANAVFAKLSDSVQNTVIDNAAQSISSLRNSLAKEDYQADTASNATAMMPMPGNRVTTAQRTALGLTLGTTDFVIVFDTDQNTPYFWSGTAWV